MRVFLFLFFISLSFNIYQYRSYRLKMEKYHQLKISLTKRKKNPSVFKQVPKEVIIPQTRRPKKSRLAKRSQKTSSAPSFREGERALEQEELSESESAPQWEEERREWDEGIQAYFLEELSLSEENYYVYQEIVENMKEAQNKIVEDFLNENDSGPYIPSFEEQKALSHTQEQALNVLSKHLGEEKLKLLLDYERKMKMKMMRENGHYSSLGIF